MLRKLLISQRIPKNALLNFQINKSNKRQMSHLPGGNPGENLPFRKCIGNPTRMTFFMTLYLTSGFWAGAIDFIYLMFRV